MLAPLVNSLAYAHALLSPFLPSSIVADEINLACMGWPALIFPSLTRVDPSVTSKTKTICQCASSLFRFQNKQRHPNKYVHGINHKECNQKNLSPLSGHRSVYSDARANADNVDLTCHLSQGVMRK